MYAQDRYEGQIGETFAEEIKTDNGGAIYGVAEPRINMCYPPPAWQTYDIDFQAAEFGTTLYGGRDKDTPWHWAR